MAERAQILVKGVVQGVGFRPFVFNLAQSLKIAGYVTNSAEGVLIDAEGDLLQTFVQRLRTEAPSLSRITDISLTRLPLQGYPDFSIRPSLDSSNLHPFTLVSPDVSICDDCLKEMLDPADRRYLYPFINCTQCGPRFSITRSVPYDRPNTTMSAFTMCPACSEEYKDPRDRRFHAQPNACAECGPQVAFRSQSSELRADGREAIVETIGLLRQGGIVAVKGLGGFHIACDATNDEAVRRLRERKRRSNKPFAVMAASIKDAKLFSPLTEEERKLLLSNRRPVVLVSKREGADLSEAVSPNNRFIGVMLPYTPLHYLLFHHPVQGNSPRAADAHFSALIMTSGNLAEEPIVGDNDEALHKLSALVDGFLMHDRDIFMRVDDSVVRVRDAACAGKLQGIERTGAVVGFVRRSRGYAPEAIELQDEGPEVLGCGADVKNTFTITKGKFAIPGQHIGDMENYETVKFFEESLSNLRSVYRADPGIVVHDLHPGYFSAKWARELGARTPSETRTVGIQHHYAHVGSVMAEHGLKGKVIGVAFDGTGYGTDGSLWGSEIMIADTEGFERTGHFKYVPLPGGESAIREPWRTAVSLVLAADRDNAWDRLKIAGFVQRYGERALDQVFKVAASPELSPPACGAGRYFDAVAALLGLCDRNTFEGEAAIALETAALEGIEADYPVELTAENEYTVADFAPAIRSLIDDIGASRPAGELSAKFHNTIEKIIRSFVLELRDRYGINDVALSGGTFQNRYLLNRAVGRLTQAGLRVFVNEKVPCNDGGISLGQAYLVRERFKRSGMRDGESGT